MPAPHPAVGAQLREAYERTGLSLTQLERLSGVSRKYIALAFDGANISLSILLKLAQALGISSIKVEGLQIEMGKPSLTPADLELAATMLDRGLKEAMEGLSLLRRHESPDGLGRGSGSGER